MRRRFPHETLLESLAEEVARRDLADFEPQNFANIIWGYAKLGHDPRLVLDGLARCTRRLRSSRCLCGANAVP